jgi:anti-anti-sigma factor
MLGFADMRDGSFPVRWVREQAVVALPEHVDASNAGQLRDQFFTLINRGVGVLVADMTATVSCDYGGADALVRAHYRASASGTQLRVAVTSPLVRRTLAVTGLDRLVSMYPSLEAALRPPQAAAPAPPAAVSPPGSGPPGPAALTPAVLWQLIDALADGMVLADGDGVLVLASRRAEDMFGYPHGELAGRRVEDLIPVDLRAAHPGQRAGYERQPAGRQMSARARLVGLRRDGTTFPVRISLTPVPTAAGSFTLAVIRDISAEPPRADLGGLARALAAGQGPGGPDYLGQVVNSLRRFGLSLQDAVGLPRDQAARQIAGALEQLDDVIGVIRDHAASPGDPPGIPAPGGSRTW